MTGYYYTELNKRDYFNGCQWRTYVWWHHQSTVVGAQSQSICAAHSSCGWGSNWCSQIIGHIINIHKTTLHYQFLLIFFIVKTWADLKTKKAKLNLRVMRPLPALKSTHPLARTMPRLSLHSLVWLWPREAVTRRSFLTTSVEVWQAVFGL
jgi:hypothetical protein